MLESVYQSKAGLNETQRDANVTVLLIDQWSVRGMETKKMRGREVFASLVPMLSISKPGFVSMRSAKGHGYTMGTGRNKEKTESWC